MLLSPVQVDVRSLLKDYLEKVGGSLLIGQFGYSDPIKFLKERCSDSFQFQGPPNNPILNLIVLQPVACQPKLPQDPQVHYMPWGTRRRAARQLDEDAMPGVAIEPEVFPADCMEPLTSIVGMGVQNVAEGDLLEVTVTELYSPSRFWVQRLCDHHNLALEVLMCDMNAYYGGAGAQRRLSLGAVLVGHHVACHFQGNWYRAVIVRLENAGRVKVRHVDYGTVWAARVAELRPLLRSFATLPTQAIRAAMAGVRPAAGGLRWPPTACSFLLSLVSHRRLVARVCAVCSASATLELQLMDMDMSGKYDLAERLLRAGHANRALRSALAGNEWYLLPTFEALESGHTLNFSDLHQCLRDGIDIEFLDEYRSYVAPLVPSSLQVSLPPSNSLLISPPPTPPVSAPRAEPTRPS